MSADPIRVVDHLLAEAEDADDVLRGTVVVLAAQPGVAWAGIGFVEGDGMSLGPSAGTPDDARRTRVEIAFEGSVVGELQVDGEVDDIVLTAIAERIAPQVLIGWDTGGEAWEA